MKQILLDTHTAIWFFDGSPNLSDAAKQAIVEPNNQNNISIVSVWELAIKINIGKLRFSGGVAGFLKLLDDNGIHILNMMPRHLLELERLPMHHRDPFDRILIAAAIAENMYIITADKNISLYPVQCVW